MTKYKLMGVALLQVLFATSTAVAQRDSLFLYRPFIPSSTYPLVVVVEETEDTLEIKDGRCATILGRAVTTISRPPLQAYRLTTEVVDTALDAYVFEGVKVLVDPNARLICTRGHRNRLKLDPSTVLDSISTVIALQSKAEHDSAVAARNREEQARQAAAEAELRRRQAELARQARERQADIRQRWPDEAEDILAGRIRLGWTDDMVRAAWGRPDAVNRSVYEWGVHEQWVYRARDYYLYFEDGILRSWQEHRQH